MRDYLRAIAMGLQRWPVMVWAFIGMLADGLLILAIPMLTGQAFDVMANPGPGAIRRLWWLAGVTLAVAIVRSAGIYLEIYMQESLGARISTDIRSELFRKLLRLPFSFFDRVNTGDIMSRLTKDIDAVRDGVGFVILITIVNVIIFIGVLVVMALINFTLTLQVLVASPFILLATVWYTLKVNPLYRTLEVRSGTLHTKAQENVSGIRVVKAFVRGKEEAAKFDAENTELLRTNISIARYNSLVNPVLEWFGGILTLICLGAGGYQVAAGRLTIGGLMSFIGLANNMYWPLRQTGWLADMISRAMAGAARIFQLLDEPEHAIGPAGKLGLVKGYLEFQNVSFGYEDGVYSVHNFNMKVAPGQRVAIVGGTGSGKTTVANLIPRFYDPSEGRILLDGRDLREWPLEQLRQAIGFVFQDNFLFSLSVRANIELGVEHAAAGAVEHAAELAQIAETTARLPAGFDTVVGERGVGLSGGEGKRVALARALLLNPPVLVLDDSTSSLDARTENAVQAALSSEASGKTVIIIAQRVATAMHADWIIVMDQGRIAEEGTHAQLLKGDGIYAELYREQMSLLTAAIGGAEYD